MNAKKWITSLVVLTMLSGCGESDEVIKVEHEFGKPITVESIIDEDASKAKIVSCDEMLEEYLDEDDEDMVLPIGIYKITIKNHHKKTNYKVKVVDTVKPEWKKFTKTVKCKKGKKIYNWNSYFKAKDLSNTVIIEVDDSDVDYDTVGTYTIEVTAKDSSNNEIKKKSSVEVVEGEVKEEEKDENEFTSEIYRPSDNQSSNNNASNNSSNSGSNDNTPVNPGPAPAGGFTSYEDAVAHANAEMIRLMNQNGWKGAQYTIGQEVRNGKVYYTVTIFEAQAPEKE